MQNIIIPTKTVDETITVEFDFQAAMLPGEIVSSVEMIVSVQTGIDPIPRRILRKSPIIVSPFSLCVVKHQLFSGIPGVIYSVTCKAFGSLGSVCEDMGLLAISTGEGLYPPFIAQYYTTPVYPFAFTDASNFGALPLSGDLRRLVWITDSAENNQFMSVPLSGFLRNPLITYSYKESSLFGATPMTGLLKSGFTSYNYRGESSIFGAMAVSGLMRTILISNNATENTNFAAQPMSGTLA